MTDEEFLVKFNSTPGRIDILRKVITAAGRANLQAMSDAELKRFWSNEVIPDPERYGTNAGAWTGLKITGGRDHRFNPDRTEKQPFHRPVDKLEAERGPNEGEILRNSFEMTDTGVAMLRALLESESGPTLIEEEATAEKQKILVFVHEAKAAVIASNELLPDQKRDLLGLLGASESILTMERPEKDLAREILTRARSLAEAFGAQALRATISELIKYLFENWPWV